MSSGPAEVSCNSSIGMGLLYTSALSDEMFMIFFSDVLRTDEELLERLSVNALDVTFHH